MDKDFQMKISWWEIFFKIVSMKFKIYDVADELARAPIKSQRVDQIMVKARTN
jgi:hypothetical protein